MAQEITEVKRRTVDVKEVSAILGISRLTVYKMARSGQLPTLKIGSRILVPIAKLKQLLGEADDAA